jgi:hypothetical protein
MPDAQRSKQRTVKVLIDEATLSRLNGRGEIHVDSIGRCYGIGEFLRRATRED